MIGTNWVSRFILGICVALILIGLGLIAWSSLLQPYTDKAAYESRYMAMGAGDSEKFFALRREMLTPKYRLLDHGWALIAVALILAPGAITHWRRLRSPASRLLIVGIGIVAVLGTIGAEIFNLMRDAERGDFPHWADSLGIPLFGMIFVAVGLCVWGAFHLGFLAGEFEVRVPLVCALTRQVNLWLAFVFCATVLIVLLYIVEGSAAHVIVGGVWLYFYASLASGRAVAKKKVAEVK
jgi:hypothetical protein